MKTKLSYVLVPLFLFLACTKDIVVKDIKGKSLTINAPANDLLTTNNQVTFWWQELDGAEQYNLQIVKPNFASVTKIICDTNLYASKCTFVLQPGTYQWRIKAFNGAGSTPYQTYSLKVDTSSNLAGQLVSTIQPIQNYLSGSTRVIFGWNALNSATLYQVIALNTSGGTVKDTITSLTTYTYNFPATSAAYTWKIRALNNNSVSQYNSPLSFTLDLSAPAASTPTTPIGSSSAPAVISPTNNLGWSRIGAPDAKYDSVFVATDSLFVNTFSKTKTYQTSLKVNQLNNTPSPNSTYYWWRLCSVDSVGNRSVYSSQQKFKLIP